MKQIKSYDPSGVLEAEGFLNNELQVGEWIFYYENGKVFSKGSFDKNGIPTGIWTEFYENGQKKYEVISKQGNTFQLENSLTQFINYWNEDGEYLIQEGKGHLKISSSENKLIHSSQWIANLKSGIFENYFEDGQLKFQCNYKDGVKQGDAKTYHANGKLYLHSIYENGILVGEYKEWYDNGFLCKNGFYRNGNLNIESFWDSDGKQTLFNGSGYLIAKYGYQEVDVYKQFYENYRLTKELRL